MELHSTLLTSPKGLRRLSLALQNREGLILDSKVTIEKEDDCVIIRFAGPRSPQDASQVYDLIKEKR